MIDFVRKLGWKIKVAIIFSFAWFVFWVYAGWAEDSLGFGFLIGTFPLVVLWWLWAGLRTTPSKDRESEFVEYLQKLNRSGFSEKRTYDRLEYPPDRRPYLFFNGQRMDIINISEKGLKLLNEKEIELKPSLKGKAVLLCGKKVPVEGKVSWSLNKEVGLLITNIPDTLIAEERGLLSSKYPRAMKMQ